MFYCLNTRKHEKKSTSQSTMVKYWHIGRILLSTDTDTLIAQRICKKQGPEAKLKLFSQFFSVNKHSQTFHLMAMTFFSKKTLKKELYLSPAADHHHILMMPKKLAIWKNEIEKMAGRFFFFHLDDHPWSALNTWCNKLKI